MELPRRARAQERGLRTPLTLLPVAKRLEKGRFLWPAVDGGTAAALTPAQVAMLLEGIDWRSPIRTDGPRLAG